MICRGSESGGISYDIGAKSRFLPMIATPGPPCPILLRSDYSMIPTLDIIDKVPSDISILIQHGKNDSQIPIQQAFLLQQKLTEVRHPDHTLITYPDLGHMFYPSSQWLTAVNGPIEPYVLADLYAWLEAHSGLSHSLATPASAIGANTTSSSSKR